jgi:hypothetical protein
MSSLWQALDEMDDYFGPDKDGDDLTDDPAPVSPPTARVRHTSAARSNPDGLRDTPSNVYLTDKAREALHPDPIRAHERQMALVAAGDVNALELAAACALWRAARAARAEVEAK